MAPNAMSRMAGFLLVGVALSAACGKTSDDTNRTNDWLTACHGDGECRVGARCLCGVCSKECETTAACGELSGAECALVGSAAFDSGCQGEPLAGLCLRTCDASCPTGTRCVEQLCVAAPDVDANASGGAPGNPDSGTGDASNAGAEAGSLAGTTGSTDAGSAGAAGAAGNSGVELPTHYGQQRVLGDGFAYGGFGQSVALSGDALVVAEPSGASGNGLAHVYRNVAGVWTPEDTLTDAVNFSSVAISGDTVLVGADDVNGVGAAYVYQRIAGKWLFQGPPLVADALPTGAAFGVDTAIEGDSLVIGAPLGGGDTDTQVGRAYVFAKSGSDWLAQGTLAPKEAIVMDRPGAAVAISGDTIVIGAPTNPTFSVPAPGKAYVFTRSGSIWTEQAVLFASDGKPRDGFGYDVALKGDTLVVGATCPCAVGGEAGAAYVFTRTDSTWTQRAKLVQADGMTSIVFGYQVAIDTGRIMVGAYQADSGKGAAYEFIGAGASWVENRKLIASDGANNDKLGFSLALDANHVAASAPGVKIDNLVVGAAYVFDLSATE